MFRFFECLFAGIRGLIARLMWAGRLCVAAGKPLLVFGGVKLRPMKGSRMRFGSGVRLSRYSLVEAEGSAVLELDDDVFLNEGVKIVAAESVRIGEGTLFGPNACVYDHDHAHDLSGVRYELTSAPVVIGKRCWIGANATITKGVSIADGVIVGAGSVVTSSLREPGIYAGTPARLVKPLDSGAYRPEIEVEPAPLVAAAS